MADYKLTAEKLATIACESQRPMYFAVADAYETGVNDALSEQRDALDRLYVLFADRVAEYGSQNGRVEIQGAMECLETAIDEIFKK